jgi:hypothetical protein
MIFGNLNFKAEMKRNEVRFNAKKEETTQWRIK